MAQGRCAGCGRIGPATKVESHSINCEQFNALFSEHPERALLPVEELARWKREERSVEARAAQKEERLSGALIEQDNRRAQQETRWAKPKDILAD